MRPSTVAAMIWIVFAVVTAGVILAVARPLMRAGMGAAGPTPEVEAYKLQLAELGREEERGTLGKEEAAQARTEISRRLLRAGRQSTLVFPDGRASFNPAVAFFIAAAAVAIGAVGLYAEYGAAGLPDQPLEARLSVPPEKQTIELQIANVERRLRAHPKDAQGWTIIAPVYFKTGQFDKAANAYRRAMQLSGEDEDKLYGLFESLTFANDGAVPATAKPILDAALARDPKSLRGRFWLAIFAGQEGRKADAEHIYREMLSENISSGWKGVIEKQLAALSEEPEGQGAESAQASGNPAQGNQGAMIRGMVERLAARLKENGADLDGWLKLIRSYAVLKETDKAQEAVASARAQFASEPQALEQIEVLVRGLGVAGAPASGGVAQSDQGAMIRGMVERLAARLKENGADLDGWLKLIRSYAVLKETDKAQEAVASARAQFASEPQALEQIENLSRGLGLAPAGSKGGQP
ncbi:MAG: c-type cytochrome biogenesis protein CcmI [Rhodomicrobium sp.]